MDGKMYRQIVEVDGKTYRELVAVAAAFGFVGGWICGVFLALMARYTIGV